MPSLSKPQRRSLATAVTRDEGIVLPLPAHPFPRGSAWPCLARTAVRITRTDRVVCSGHHP
jgi:hypothetical protein